MSNVIRAEKKFPKRTSSTYDKDSMVVEEGGLAHIYLFPDRLHLIVSFLEALHWPWAMEIRKCPVISETDSTITYDTTEAK